MNAITSAEDRALNAHLARTDRFAELDEMSFAELLTLEDDLSEGSQWSLLDDVRLELNVRRAEALGRLSRVFADAIRTHADLPMVHASAVGSMSIDAWVAEWATTNDGAAAAKSMLFNITARARWVADLAAEFAKDNAEELLRAGWSQ